MSYVYIWWNTWVEYFVYPLSFLQSRFVSVFVSNQIIIAMSQEFLCQIQSSFGKFYFDNNENCTSRGEQKMHSRTTPIDTIAAMKPLRDIWWQLHNKNQILLKDTKKQDWNYQFEQNSTFWTDLILIAQNKFYVPRVLTSRARWR